MYPVTLTGRAVTLREFRSDDAAASLAIVGDDQVTQWLSFDSRDLDAARAMIDGAVRRAQDEPRTEYYLAAAADNDELVGFARLALAGVRAAKLGYAIRADRWGKGYATDAARLMITFGFEHLRLHRISAAIGPDNAASIAVVEKLGMQYEGRIRDHVFTNGAWRDSLLYAVLDHEWVPSA
ncbi:MAG TPA: GNAT family protein [Actinoplanes sp.]|jgi:RimJ/RimL family protein N-acetyltransferase